MDDRGRRLAKNETILRAANREIQHATEQLRVASDSEMETLCECGRESCDALITLTKAEYEAAHSESDRFVVAPGHENVEIEGVVERHETYSVVDKFGEAETIAEKSDQ